MNDNKKQYILFVTALNLTSKIARVAEVEGEIDLTRLRLDIIFAEPFENADIALMQAANWNLGYFRQHAYPFRRLKPVEIEPDSILYTK